LTQGPVSTVEPQEIRPGVQRLEGWAQSVKLLAIKRVPWQIDIRAAMGAACCMYVCPLDGPLFPSRAVDQGPEGVVQCTPWRCPSTRSEPVTGLSTSG
jgi:hypothetical protein